MELRSLLTLTIIFPITSSQNCNHMPETLCDFEVSAWPIAKYAFAQKLGVTLESCLSSLEKFSWPVGIYCPDIQFCGLGFDFTVDYRSQWDRDQFSPTQKDHVCSTIVNTKDNSCDDFQKELHMAGLFSGWRCDGGGAEMCMVLQAKKCDQIEGNIICDGCLPGFEETNTTTGDVCEDIKECEINAGICGEFGTCIELPGSYSCDCDAGYKILDDITTTPRPICVVEYPGWNVEILYHASSGDDFLDLLQSTLNDPSPSTTSSGSENFVNTMFHDNLHKANLIMLVIYDDKNRLREQLTFEGVQSVWNWFQAKNLIDSVLWGLDFVNDIDIFKLNPDPDSFIFEITKDAGSGCGATGFFKMTCDISTECDEMKWWLEEPSLNNKPCGVLYSKYNDPLDYINGFWASKIQILTKNIFKRHFELVYLVEAFAGVDAYHYYDSGLLVNPDGNGVTHAHKLFRHPIIRSKIESATFIQLQVYNFEMTKVVSTVIFHGTNDFYSWFAGNNVVNSSLWDITNWSTGSSSGRYFQLGNVPGSNNDFLRTFFINELYGGCSADQGWFVVASKTTDKNAPCYWEHWWQKTSITEKGLDVANQPPYILYATTAESQTSSLWSDGGKIEISVLLNIT